MSKDAGTRDTSFRQAAADFIAGVTAVPDELPESNLSGVRRAPSFTGRAKRLRPLEAGRAFATDLNLCVTGRSSSETESGRVQAPVSILEPGPAKRAEPAPGSRGDETSAGGGVASAQRREADAGEIGSTDTVHFRDVAELIEQCGRGDARAWDAFVVRYHRRIVFFVLRASRGLGGPDGTAHVDASDLVQEVYLRLLANDRRLLREFRGATEASVLSYLARTVVSAVTDCARRKCSKKRTANLVPLETSLGANGDTGRILNSLAAPESNEPGRQLDDRLALAWLRKLLEETLTGPNRRRDALIFFFYAIDGLTAREIASLPAISLTVGNVDSIIHRTRERLRLKLRDSSGDPSPLAQSLGEA